MGALFSSGTVLWVPACAGTTQVEIFSLQRCDQAAASAINCNRAKWAYSGLSRSSSWCVPTA